MHGVSEVIAIILILMITIAIAGLAYTFMSSTMASTTSAASSAVTTTTSSMLTSFAIESISQNHVYIRNTGQNTLEGFSAYVNDETVDFTAPASISPGSIGTINITSVVLYGDRIRVSSSKSASAEKPATAEWYGAVGYWKLDEGTGTTTYDSSSNSIQGNIEYGTWSNGAFSNGLEFNGTYGCIKVTPFPQLLGNKTITGWIYRDTSSTRGTIFTIDDSDWGYRGYSFRVDSNGKLAFRIGNGTDVIGVETKYSVSSVPSGRWVFVAAIYDASNDNVEFFIDGVHEGPYTFTLPNHISYNSMGIMGGEDCNGNEVGIDGKIDDVAIWNRTLSVGEIAKLYSKSS